MRIGKRMKEILDILSTADSPMSLTEIIMEIYEVDPIREEGKKHPPFIQAELASAIARESVTGGWCGCDTKVVEKKTKKEYHPVDYTNKLYALYSRSIRRLREQGFIKYGEAYTIFERQLIQREYYYRAVNTYQLEDKQLIIEKAS